jgi:hypothetical protein
MKMYGIRKVYYSTNEGLIVHQNIVQLYEERTTHVSHGLMCMTRLHTEMIKTRKLPLSKSQKTYLLSLTQNKSTQCT